VARAGIEAARLGVRSSISTPRQLRDDGADARRGDAASAAARDPRPKILAVTVLTSLRKSDLRVSAWPPRSSTRSCAWPGLARKAGMDGVVTSPLEIARIRRECGRGFLIETPRVRPARRERARGAGRSEAHHDARGAMRLGADYLVLGRPIRDARDPLAAVQEVVAEMARGISPGAGQAGDAG